jgi:DNA-binding response OmpR family regulator
VKESHVTQSELSGRRTALVVDDEPDLVRLVTAYLEREQFKVVTAGDGERAVVLAREVEPDVIVLDLMLPVLDGVEACRRIRMFSDAYVIMLTAKGEEVDKLVGLSVGADDYMVKPISPRELVARVHVLLRRPRSGSSGEDPGRRFGDLTIDPASREVRRSDVLVELTRLEFDLLDVLSERPRLVFSRQQLIDRVWGEEWIGDDHLVDVHIAKLRRKLGDDAQAPRYIRTVRGVGYRMGAGR